MAVPKQQKDVNDLNISESHYFKSSMCSPYTSEQIFKVHLHDEYYAVSKNGRYAFNAHKRTLSG
jgi:hypothetical protein